MFKNVRKTADMLKGLIMLNVLNQAPLFFFSGGGSNGSKNYWHY